MYDYIVTLRRDHWWQRQRRLHVTATSQLLNASSNMLEFFRVTDGQATVVLAVAVNEIRYIELASRYKVV